MTKLIERILVVAVLVAAGVWAAREMKIRRMAAPAAAPTEVAQSAAQPEPVVAATGREPDATAPGIARAATEEPAATPDDEQDETVPSLVGKSVRVEQEPPDEFLARISDPKRKNYIRAELVVAMDPIYAPLFRCFQMSPEQLAYIKYLLAEKRVVDNEYNLRTICAAKADRMAVAREGEQRAAEWETKIRDFLGPEAYDLYEGYNRSLPERMIVKECKQKLEAVGHGLTYEQEDAVIRTMYEERRNSIEMRELMGNENPALIMDRIRGRVDIVTRDYDAMAQRVALRCQSQLQPAQYASLTNQLAVNRASIEGILTLLSTMSDEEIVVMASGRL